MPLSNMSNQHPSSHLGDHVVNIHQDGIPLTPIRTGASTGARKEGHTMDPDTFDKPHQFENEDTGLRAHIGRRRARANTMTSNFEEAGKKTRAGKIYETLLNFSIVTRYFIYLVPLSLCFLTVILVCHFVDGAKDAKIGTVPLKWFFVWVCFSSTGCEERASNLF